MKPKRIWKNTTGRSLIALAMFAFVALLSFPAYAADSGTNVSVLYGWNGTNYVPLLTESSGRLRSDFNISKGVGISPEGNNSYNLGSTSSQWASVFACGVRSAGDLSLFAGSAERVTVNASGRVGIGNANPQQTLVVAGQVNVTGTIFLNGTTTIRTVLYNWPSADGAANQILTTNGTGGLTWANFTASSASNYSAVNVTAGSFGADVGGGSYSFPNNLSVIQNISASDRITDKTGFVTPVGMIMLYGASTAPAGWLVANGSEVSRTTYADLFNITGTRYGNTSGTTFTLPDFRQRFALGKADSGTGSTLGGTGGTIDHLHTGPSHTHGYSTVISHTHSADPPSTGSDSQGSHTHSVDFASTASGAGSSHTHSFDPPSTNTNTSGGSTHTFPKRNSREGGDLYNTISGASSASTSSSGSHTHSDIDLASFTSGAETSHTHSTDIGSTTSSSNGGHTHSTDVASFTSGSTGSASGTSDAGGTGNTGTGNPPFIALYYIIKY